MSNQQEYLPLQLREQFEVVKKLGQGTEGIVFEIKDKKTKENYALKLIRNLSQEEQKILTIFKENNHRNIINIFGIYEFQQYFWILMEHCDKSLFDQIQQKLVDQKDLRYLMVSIADGLKHLHSLGIIHRDLKPENILVKIIKDPHSMHEQYIYKICDFGLSKIVDVTQTQQIGTCYYMAPELISNKKYDKKVDIWSFGTIIYELVTGEPLFNGQSQNEILQQIINLQNEQEYKKMIEKIASKISDEYLQLIQKMLIIESTNRCDIDEVVRGLRQRYSSPPKKLDTPQPFHHKTLGRIVQQSNYENHVKFKNTLDTKFGVNNNNEKKQNFMICQYKFDNKKEASNNSFIQEQKKQKDEPQNVQQALNQSQNNPNQLFQQGTQQFQQNIQQNQLKSFNQNQQRYFSPQNDKFKVFNKIDNSDLVNSPRIVKESKDNQGKNIPDNIVNQFQQSQIKQFQQNKLTSQNQIKVKNFSHNNGQVNELNAKNSNHSPNSLHTLNKDNQIKKEFPLHNQQQQQSKTQQFQQQKPFNFN